MINPITGLSSAELRRVIVIKEKIEALERELAGFLGDAGKAPVPAARAIKRRRMSAAGRAAISRAAKLRWARVRAGKRGKATAPAPAAKKRRLSPEGRARIIAAAKARWAKVNAAKS